MSKQLLRVFYSKKIYIYFHYKTWSGIIFFNPKNKQLLRVFFSKKQNIYTFVINTREQITKMDCMSFFTIFKILIEVVFHPKRIKQTLYIYIYILILK